MLVGVFNCISVTEFQGGVIWSWQFSSVVDALPKRYTNRLAKPRRLVQLQSGTGGH